jgi:hypothetical protein
MPMLFIPNSAVYYYWRLGDPLLIASVHAALLVLICLLIGGRQYRSFIRFSLIGILGIIGIMALEGVLLTIILKMQWITMPQGTTQGAQITILRDSILVAWGYFVIAWALLHTICSQDRCKGDITPVILMKMKPLFVLAAACLVAGLLMKLYVVSSIESGNTAGRMLATVSEFLRGDVKNSSSIAIVFLSLWAIFTTHFRNHIASPSRSEAINATLLASLLALSLGFTVFDYGKLSGELYSLLRGLLAYY